MTGTSILTFLWLPAIPLPALPANDRGPSGEFRPPVAFVENLGQWATPARFVARRSGANAHLAPDSLTLQLLRVEPETPGFPSRTEAGAEALGLNLRFTFEEASLSARLVGREELPTRHHFFLGADPGRWRRGVRGFARVACEGLYPGVDLLWREEGANLEYDLLLGPEADLGRIVVRVEGASGGLRVDDEGSLRIETALGEVRQTKPTSWEEGAGDERRPFACSFRLLGEDRFGFEGRPRTPGLGLVVDPGLLHSSFLGGAGGTNAFAVALDAIGAAVVTGQTTASNYPTTPGAFDPTHNGLYDVFVTRLPGSGAPPTYSTFLGGQFFETALAVVADSTGGVVLAGFTQSSNFPTTPGAYDPTHSGTDAFVTRLSSSGGALSYSTFLGGPGGGTYANALVLDPAGAAVLCGQTTSASFPTTSGAFDASWNGAGDAFVARLPLTGAPPSYSSFLGGPGDDAGLSVALDGAGFAIVAGRTYSTNFPTTSGAFDPSANGAGDAFVARLPLSGGPLAYSSFLGGSSDEVAWACALDPAGAAVVAGRTHSANFPTTPGALATNLGGPSDAFLARLPFSGGALSYGTLFGGSGDEVAASIGRDALGNAIFAGLTNSPDFPTTPGAFDTTPNGANDAIVVRLRLAGGPPLYSTVLGGSSGDWALSLALGATGNAAVAGSTQSIDFPSSPGGFGSAFHGGVDAFLTLLDALPEGAAPYGASTPGCSGPLPIGVTAMPQAGSSSFAITCGHAPPNAMGALAFAASPLSTPLVLLGVSVWIQPASTLVVLPASSDATGAAIVPVPIPAGSLLLGSNVYVQFAWPGPSAPSPPCPATGYSASNALAITIQS